MLVLERSQNYWEISEDSQKGSELKTRLAYIKQNTLSRSTPSYVFGENSYLCLVNLIDTGYSITLAF